MIDSKLKTNISVIPKGSQVFLIGLLLLIAFLFGLSVYLLINNIEAWGYFFIAAIMLCFWAMLAWRSSNDNIDLATSYPTTLTTSKGESFSTDTSVLRNPEAANVFIQLIQEAIQRKPLPEPEGLVGSNHELLLNSQNQAKQEVNQINSEYQGFKKEILDNMGIPSTDSMVTQNALGSEKPIID
jgi:hypothetical protein